MIHLKPDLDDASNDQHTPYAMQYGKQMCRHAPTKIRALRQLFAYTALHIEHGDHLKHRLYQT